MPTLNFIHADARVETVSAQSGDSAMVAATRHGVAEIVGECGGNAMCATCHVYVDEKWLQCLPSISDEEDGLLYGTAAPRQPNSRLSCQIRITPELDGIIFRLPLPPD